jgi:NAD(P)-dependent dehydrogenase (short-subunit alcohol dehydrogenase family)
MSKRAVESLTDTLRIELGPTISVSVIQPGFFASKMCTGKGKEKVFAFY